MSDRIRLFRGMPIKFGEDILIHSPTVDDIATAGEDSYHFYLLFATFDRSRLVRMFGLDVDDGVGDYDLLTDNVQFGNLVAESIGFFIKENVFFNAKSKTFSIENRDFLNENNYIFFVEKVRNVCVQNGETDSDRQELRFKDDKTRKEYEEMLSLKKKYGKDESSLDLKDICSILCGADGNGVNFTNVGTMTIYQVFEHWERLCIKESHLRLVRVWANGHLSDPSKLQEWMVKTRL